MEQPSKSCTRCAVEQPPEEFYISRGRPYTVCRTCIKAQVSEHRRSETGRQQAARAGRKRRMADLGLTIEEYDHLVEMQNGVCGACKRADPRGRLAVDHCHLDGRIRGLLCRACNLAIGYAANDPIRLRAMADYLS